MSGETVRQIIRGTCSDGISWYVPGVNCMTCGRFVGRDGDISIGTFEMSETVAWVEGECRRCLGRSPVSLEPRKENEQ